MNRNSPRRLVGSEYYSKKVDWISPKLELYRIPGFLKVRAVEGFRGVVSIRDGSGGEIKAQRGTGAYWVVNECGH